MPPGAAPPAPFDLAMPPDPDFPPRPAVAGGAGPELPARPDLSLAAAPVPTDYAPPRAPDFTVPSRAAGLVLSADASPAAAPPAPAPPAAAATPGPGADAAVPAGPSAADAAVDAPTHPSYIWDLAATDVFPAAPGAFPAPDAAAAREASGQPEPGQPEPGQPKAPGDVPADDDPGAFDS